MKATKSYDGRFKELKQLFDTKRKLDDNSLSAIFCKIKSEIEDLKKGIIGASMVKNFFTNAKRILSPIP